MTLTAARPAYTERVHVPWHWWLLGLLFAASVLLAVGFSVGPGWGLGVTGVIVALVSWCFLSYGGVAVRVDDDGLHAGRALLGWAWLGRVRPHTADSGRDRLGPGADVRAWLFVRPYLRGMVEVAVEDPADPHPYWLISTRHPERLASALEASRPAEVR